MRPKLAPLFIFCLFFLLFSSGRQALYSQSVAEIMEFGYGYQGYGARAIGLGHAFVPIANDYSALYWNPAGLGQIKKGIFYAEISGTSFQNTASFYSESIADDKIYFNLKALGFVLPLPVKRGSLVLSGGYQQKKDFHNFLMFTGFNPSSNSIGWFFTDEEGFFPFDQYVRQTERVFTDGGLGEYSFGASIAVSPRLLLGISATYLKGDYKYAFEFLQEDIYDIYNDYPGNFTSYALRQTINAKVEGWGARLGALLSFWGSGRLGATVEIPTTYLINEEYSENDILEYDDGYTDETQYEPGKWSYQIYYPWKYSFGLAWVEPTWLITTTVEYADFRNARFEMPEGRSLNGDYLELLDQNRLVSATYQPYLSLQAGFQVQPSEYWPVFRTGIRQLSSPLSGSTDEETRKMASFGIEFGVGQGAAMIMTYALELWKQDSTDDLAPGIVEENIRNQAVFVGLEIGF